MTAAQPHCDPLTQYEQNGQCCKMCEPGTRMHLPLSTCQEPHCIQCGWDEYQDKYTTEPKCERQKYCDPKGNFEVDVSVTPKKRRACRCELGFHCSSEACLTCVQHRVCERGYGAQSKGNQTHDTVCQRCPPGTFSDEISWDSDCEKWNECETGFHTKEAGTDTSDYVCEKDSRVRVMVICVVSVGIVFIILIVIYYLHKGKQGAKTKLKGCVESCLGEEKEPQKEVNLLIETPTDAIDEEIMLPKMQVLQEEVFSRTPEETEDEPPQEESADELFTDKGNLVAQEDGETEKISRQESQPSTD
ncbi:tumor necrosis factor receptor superfamily member 5 isoform X2 [Pempheris klunzingeri]